MSVWTEDNDFLDTGDWYDEPAIEVECRYCGKGGLHWEEDDGKFRLAEKSGYLHECHRVAHVNDFENLDA